MRMHPVSFEVEPDKHRRLDKHIKHHDLPRSQTMDAPEPKTREPENESSPKK